MAKYLTAVVVGIVLGMAGPKYVFLGPYSLIPWGIVALVLGFWCSKRESLNVGAVYGFSLSLAFLIAGYTGTASLISVLPFFLVLAVFGAICGLVLSVTGYFLKLRFARPGSTI
jgi:membrane-bound metal-dependent hydrolase YbcI (DUF457 family)